MPNDDCNNNNNNNNNNNSSRNTAHSHQQRSHPHETSTTSPGPGSHESLLPVVTATLCDRLPAVRGSEEQFAFYWKNFLLTRIEPTPAAALALLALKGSHESLKTLEDEEEKWKRLQSQFINVILATGNLPTPHSIHRAKEAIRCHAENFFTNFYALNKAFLFDPTAATPAHTATLESVTALSPCTDWKAVKLFYKGLEQAISNDAAETGESDLCNKVLGAISKIGDRLESILDETPQSLLEPHQLRFLLLFLSCPLLDSFSADAQYALRQLFRIGKKLQSSSRIILTGWYATAIPVDILEDHLATAQQFITVRILDAANSADEGSDTIISIKDLAGPSVREGLNFIEILFEANKRRSLRAATTLDEASLRLKLENPGPFAVREDVLAPLPIASFYNDGINHFEEMIRHDFETWRRNIFSDFELKLHAFTIDAANKNWYLLHRFQHWQIQYGRFGPFRIPILKPFFVVRVRRSEIVQDALRELTATASQADLRKRLRVVFDKEEGIDAGGVQKEFFQLLVRELFNPDYGMFEYLEDTSVFWFNGASLESNLQFELIGVILGLALNNGVILDIHFPLAVYKKLLSVPVGLCDLEEFKPDVTRSLRQLLVLPPEDVKAWQLTFTLETHSFDTVVSRPLLPDQFDADYPVTAENRRLYVEALLDWMLNGSISQPFEAFRKGFMKCCEEEFMLTMFQPSELLLSICGSTQIDLHALEQAVVYQDGYTSESETIRDFWEIVHAFDEKDKKRFLFFVTGSDRVPIKGLGSVRFFIGRGSSDTDRVPSAHTCFNFLLLPDYCDKDKLKKYLFIALDNHTGFGLR